MARTVGDCFNEVYVTLQDTARTRYLLNELQAFMLDAVIEARSIRPDLFIGRLEEDLSLTPVAETDPFPLPSQFFPAVSYYISGRAELRDDEFAADGRAMTLLSAYGKKLLAGA
jgi:hypothetical protein